MGARTILQAESPERQRRIEESLSGLGKQFLNRGAVSGFEVKNLERNKITGVYVFLNSEYALEVDALPFKGYPSDGTLTVATLIKYDKLLNKDADGNEKLGTFVSEVCVARVDYSSSESTEHTLRQSLLRLANSKLDEMSDGGAETNVASDLETVRRQISYVAKLLKSPTSTNNRFAGVGARR